MVPESARNDEHSAMLKSLVEIVAVGESSCLHRVDNGASAILNRDAAWIWRSRCDGLSDTDIAGQLAARISVSIEQAKSHVATLGAQLDTAGFLDPPPVIPSRIRPQPDCSVTSVHAAARDRSTSLRIGFKSQPSAAFVTDDPHLAELLAENLGPLIGKDTARPFTKITATTTSNGFDVDRDGYTVASNCDLGIVRRVIIQSLMLALLPRENVAAILHASSIAIAERGVILAGTSGSGKTTLMMTLVNRGAKYLCDDFTSLGATGDRISSFPLAASLKSQTWDLLKREFPTIDQAKQLQVVNRQVRYIDPAPNDPVIHTTITPAMLVFPHFQLGASIKSRPLSPEESLGLLLTTGSEIVGASNTIKSLVNFANTTPAIALTYGDVSEAAAMIEQRATR